MLAIVVGLAVGGCANRETDQADPFAADVAQARSRASSDLQRAILEDGQVSRAEYEEAVDAYVDCLNSRGVPAAKTLNSGGYYDYATQGQGDISSTMFSCATGTVADIDYLYTERLRNPQHLPEAVIMAACLVRKGEAPTGYSADDYSADEAASFANAPFDADKSEAFSLCSVNPNSP